MALLQSVWVGHPTSVMPLVNYLIIKNTYIYPLILSFTLICLHSVVCLLFNTQHSSLLWWLSIPVHCAKTWEQIKFYFQLHAVRDHTFSSAMAKISFQCNKHELNNWSAILPLSRRRCFIRPWKRQRTHWTQSICKRANIRPDGFFPSNFHANQMKLNGFSGQTNNIISPICRRYLTIFFLFISENFIFHCSCCSDSQTCEKSHKRHLHSETERERIKSHCCIKNAARILFWPWK